MFFPERLTRLHALLHEGIQSLEHLRQRSSSGQETVESLQHLDVRGRCKLAPPTNVSGQDDGFFPRSPLIVTHRKTGGLPAGWRRSKFFRARAPRPQGWWAESRRTVARGLGGCFLYTVRGCPGKASLCNETTPGADGSDQYIDPGTGV